MNSPRRTYSNAIHGFNQDQVPALTTLRVTDGRHMATLMGVRYNDDTKRMTLFWRTSDGKPVNTMLFLDRSGDLAKLEKLYTIFGLDPDATLLDAIHIGSAQAVLELHTKENGWRDADYYPVTP